MSLAPFADVCDRVAAALRAECDERTVFVPPPTQAEIAAWEARYDLALPLPLRTFFQRVPGTEPGGAMWGGAWLTLWSLKYVQPLTAADASGWSFDDDFLDSVPEPGAWFLFADHLLQCFVYAVRLRVPYGGEYPVLLLNGDSEVPPRRPHYTQFIADTVDPTRSEDLI